jgi:GH43 family beta-xylosidase
MLHCKCRWKAKCRFCVFKSDSWVLLTACCLVILFSCCILNSGAAQGKEHTFTNPLLPSGADPWVIYKDGYYFYTHTLGDRISIWKTDRLTHLKAALVKTVWTPPPSGLNSKHIWAPELHFLEDKWYLYYTATDKENPGDDTRYVFVLENTAADPLEGTWVDKGRVNTEHSGLDGSVFAHHEKRYFVYSAYAGPQSVLVVARMKDPWTLEGDQVAIATPTYGWEKKGGREILEGPQFLKGEEGKVFIIYSASACWSDEYALGMLTASGNADLLDAGSWKKSPVPVFSLSPANNVYAPGHNSFFKSPDGSEDWILYHANTGPGQGCDQRRSPRAQRFSWSKDGTPVFGEPVKVGEGLSAPSKGKQ